MALLWHLAVSELVSLPFVPCSGLWSLAELCGLSLGGGAALPSVSCLNGRCLENDAGG